MFRYDNGFSRILEKFADGIVVTLLWLVFCIPVITAGQASAALCHTVRKSLRCDEGYVLRTFWTSFRNGFWQGTRLWLSEAALLCLFYYEKELVYDNFLLKGSASGILYYFFAGAFLWTTVWTFYTTAYFVRFEDPVRMILKNTALIAVVNLHWTVVILGLFLLAAAIVFVMPVTALLFPVPMCLVYDRIFDRIFRKYLK